MVHIPTHLKTRIPHKNYPAFKLFVVPIVIREIISKITHLDVIQNSPSYCNKPLSFEIFPCLLSTICKNQMEPILPQITHHSHSIMDMGQSESSC